MSGRAPLVSSSDNTLFRPDVGSAPAKFKARHRACSGPGSGQVVCVANSLESTSAVTFRNPETSLEERSHL